MKTQLTVLVIVVVFLTWCGVTLGRWANAQVTESENRNAALVEVLK